MTKENLQPNSFLRNATYSLTVLAGLASASFGEQLRAAEPDAAPAKVVAKDAANPLDAALPAAEFDVTAESFADLQVLRYQVPGFEQLSLQEKKLAYYLYEAALSGRDMIYDQKDKHGLLIRKTLENVYKTYTGDRECAEWQQFKDYCGRFWFSGGNHHHYGNDKFVPACSFEYFEKLVQGSSQSGFPVREGESVEQLAARLKPLIFDPALNPKLVDLRPGIDNVQNSSVNFYEGVTQAEVEEYYNQFNSVGETPMWGINSKVEKRDGHVIERPWMVGGMYGPAIERTVHWLEKACTVAENEQQKEALEKLVAFYRSGKPEDFDAYNIAWVKDTKSRIDLVNGFIEVYNDPIGKKGSFESVVSIRDEEATRRIGAIVNEAQWFEDHSPILPQHKKERVVGISAKAITVVVESGDSAPATPIGINLPNSDWIRRDHGSKSVSLSNIVHSYNVSSARAGSYAEFAYSPEYVTLNERYGALSSDLHTDMHEGIGHASGKLNPGVDVPEKTLKGYASTLEEARADLVALYYILDPKLVEIGVMPNLDVGKTEYNNYITNGLISQLVRLKPGDNLEEAHMRNRQLIAKWAYEHGKADNVIEFVKRDDKTYVRINDYDKLRGLFGQLLCEVQRVKSEGDYEAGKNLVEDYGVKVDQELLKEVLDRYAKLDLKPYKGFVQPKLHAVEIDGEIVDVTVEYPESFFAQMIEYGEKYSTLPVEN